MSIRTRKWTTPNGEAREAYVVDYRDQNGKRHLKTFDRIRDAKEFRSNSHVEIIGRVHVADADTITIAESAKQWLATCDEAGLERSTVTQYRQHVDLHIVPFIGARRLNEVTVPFVRAFLDQLRAEGRSAAMIRAVRVSFGSMISDAQERGLVARNSVKEMARTRKARAKTEARHKRQIEVGVDIPTTPEVKAMLFAAEGKARVFLMTAAMTGMRASELRGLRWSDVNLPKAEVTVRQRADAWQDIGSPKSAKGRRTIPLPGPLVAALKAWRHDCPKGTLDLVFPNGEGKVEWHANIVSRWLQPAQVRAGITATTGKMDKDGEPVLGAKYTGLHALRHFYASWLINRKEDGGLGLPPKVVQERMGHSSIQMTLDVYSHLFPRNDDTSDMDAAASAITG